MGEIVSICNQKGGVGKTTTTINLGSSLAAAEKRVLIVDFDPQANTTSGLGIQKNSTESNSYNLVSGIGDFTPQKTAISFLDLIPSTSDLVGADIELIDTPDREYRLKKALAPFVENYDYIFIDCPPSLSFLTVNALTAASFVLVPVQCEYYALEGLADLMKTIDLIKQSLNPELQVSGILLTMFDGRNNLSHEVEMEIRKHFQGTVYETVIPRNIRLSEAPSHGKPVLLYDIKSKGSECYLELAKEFLGRRSPAEQKGEGTYGAT